MVRMVKRSSFKRKSNKAKSRKYATVGTVKRLIGRRQEKKEYYINGLDVALSTTATVVDLFKPTQGTTDNQRIGDSVMLKNLHLKYHLFGDASSARANIVRIILFQWKENTTPTASHILKDTSAGNSLVSPYENDNRLLRNILHDKRYVIGPTAGAYNGITSSFAPGGALSSAFITKLIKKVQFDAGSTSGSNKLYMLAVCQNSTNPPSLTYYSTASYSDA